MKKVGLKNKIKILTIELHELELPERVNIQIIEDMFFDPYDY